MNYSNKLYREQKLAKDPNNGKVAGVCAGIARHYNTPRLAVRGITILAAFILPMLVAFAYLITALILPKR